MQELNEKEKITIISKIDELQVSKGNHFRLASLKRAVNKAREIIKLAKKGGFASIIEEEKRFIAQIEGGYYSFEKIARFKKAAENLRIDFNSLFDKQQFTEAHQLVEKFSETYPDYLTTFTLAPIEHVLMKDRQISKELKEQNDDLLGDLEKHEKEFNKCLKNNDRASARDILDEAWGILFQLNDKSLQEKWAMIENDFLDRIELSEVDDQGKLIEKLEQIVENASLACDHNDYDKALNRIEKGFALLEGKELGEYQETLTIKKNEIIKAKQEEEFSKKIEELDFNLKGNLENKRFGKALKNCEDIIQIAKDQGDDKTIEQYQRISDQIREEIERERIAKKKIEKELQEKAQELESVIQIDDDVVPLVEEFSVEEILGDLSDDLAGAMEQIGLLLEDHRVEIKNEGESRAILISNSGEVVETDKSLEAIETSDDAGEKLNVSMQSGFTNPFDDIIEQAIITDLIPYNFEISELELNGQKLTELPDKTLTEKGVKIDWEFRNIPPREKMEINYNLRRRVSRTIIFVLEGNVKIIKTHSNLRELELEGLYDALMPFTNSYESVIQGVIMEDVIPLYYLHLIKSPENITPANISKSTNGNLIKWNLGELEQETLPYHYKLLELYKYEEIKMLVRELHDKALDLLRKERIPQSREKFAQIADLLIKYTQ